MCVFFKCKQIKTKKHETEDSCLQGEQQQLDEKTIFEQIEDATKTYFYTQKHSYDNSNDNKIQTQTKHHKITKIRKLNNFFL